MCENEHVHGIHNFFLQLMNLFYAFQAELVTHQGQCAHVMDHPGVQRRTYFYALREDE
jgi:hypothetical protein